MCCDYGPIIPHLGAEINTQSQWFATWASRSALAHPRTLERLLRGSGAVYPAPPARSAGVGVVVDTATAHAT